MIKNKKWLFPLLAGVDAGVLIGVLPDVLPSWNAVWFGLFVGSFMYLITHQVNFVKEKKEQDSKKGNN
ncbi:MAG: hypothetical protein LBI43_00795 [Streptococcaceae bacterium]|jgi:hypothetical protein|nr:hypothetical protein [Streptococcaceae bacterium]